MADYAERLKGQIDRPRDYIEHQLAMSEEEKEERSHFFAELFAKHEEQRGNELQTTAS